MKKEENKEREKKGRMKKDIVHVLVVMKGIEEEAEVEAGVGAEV